MAEILCDEFQKETVILSEQVVAHVLYRRFVDASKELDFFARIRNRGEHATKVADVIADIDDARDRLARLEREGAVHMSSSFRHLPAEQLLYRTLALWNGYHSRKVAEYVRGKIVIVDPPLLVYYQNRMIPFAERVAPEAFVAAARIIASYERGLV